MEADEREILIARRVELVEDIDIQGGLFTQLLSRKVLLRRTVNKIKLNRTPEEQVEELLNELPKRECFEDFCQALIADGQEHIVKKYLKAPLAAKAKPQTVEPQPTPAVTPQCPTPTNPEGVSGESTDSFSGLSQAAVKRQHSSTLSSSAMVCIREEDNHVCITVREEGASPEKRKRAIEAGTASLVSALSGPVTYEEDETRYAMKHFVSQESGEQADKSLVPLVNGNRLHSSVVLKNPQSIVYNQNIVDHARYLAAFPGMLNSAHPSVQASLINLTPSLSSTSEMSAASLPSTSIKIQSAAATCPPHLSSPLKDPSSRVNKQEAETAQIRNLLRPQQGQSPQKIEQLKPSQQKSFVRLIPGSQDSQQLPNKTGLLNATKTAEYVYQAASLSRSLSSNQYDAADTAMCDSPSKSININQTFSDLQNSGLLDVTSENLIKCVDERAFTEPAGRSCSVGGGDGGLGDMDQIDLPDGCVNVKVEHCTRQFFMANHKKAYPMRQIPRGLALIINVDEVEGKPARKGTNFDRDNLCNLLCQLHFNIIVYNDKDGLSAQEMVNKLKEFAKLPDHADMDACFVCLLSHGEEGFIFGTDGKRIPLEEIFMLFGNTNCKGLIGKPKVFIIQACRGGYLDKGVRLDEVDGGSLPAPSSTPSSRMPVSGSGAAPQQLPSMSDMLVCYPTLTGYYAWRNRARGSWYIEAIVQVFMRYAKCEDVCAMLNRVNQLVSKKVSECNQKEMNAMSQMSEYKSSLRQPHLFLFPGIGICMKPPQ